MQTGREGWLCRSDGLLRSDRVVRKLSTLETRKRDFRVLRASCELEDVQIWRGEVGRGCVGYRSFAENRSLTVLEGLLFSCAVCGA